MRARRQPARLMELLQITFSNPLNLDLIWYPCSEHGWLASNPGITSAAELRASEAWNGVCCHPAVTVTDSVQPGVERQNKHSRSHVHVLRSPLQTQNTFYPALCFSSSPFLLFLVLNLD